ncbi:MAG TPA: hypothetical protein DCZ92_07370 [Elusimicrobia bacterium]|nr:MAG: hypothetical protein A2016_03725 [Elusimicrobia bacterium GWF2_62_30]HBA60626.1 hypothetical protein [Elusimicrobiota bacterium]
MQPCAALLFFALLLPGPSFAEEGLPEFKLNNLKKSGLRLAESGIYIPPASPPMRVAGPRIFRLPEPAPLPQKHPLYRPYKSGFVAMPGGFMRLRLGSGGKHGTDNVRFDGRISIKVNEAGGQAEIKFPEARFEDPMPGDEAFFFVRISGEGESPELSWAEVVCADEGYLGYKGANFSLPEESGDYSLVETVAVGGRKGLIGGTHPWLAGAGAKKPSRLCSRDFRGKTRDYNAKTLPKELGGFRFRYNAGENTLKISWKTD